VGTPGHSLTTAPAVTPDIRGTTCADAGDSGPGDATARGVAGGAATAPLTGAQLATVAPFPFIVWGADELRRLILRRHQARHRTDHATVKLSLAVDGAPAIPGRP
jgi:hypothetical protein